MSEKKNKYVEFEEQILKYWQKNNSFQRSNELSRGKKAFTFYDGPPFATGLPHYGHILSGTMKDVVTRYKYQNNFHVERRFGWDCHGLPIEYEIDKKLNITDRKQVLEMGIEKYNSECRSIVMRYSSQWKYTVERMGRWVDFENGYKTLDHNFMMSVWYIFKQLYDKGLVYRGYKVMPFSTGCMTPLSNFEANLNYKSVMDPSIFVAFPLKEKLNGKDASLIAWTTTPWTLPSNCGIVVNENFEYSIFSHNESYYIMLSSRIDNYFENAVIVDKIKGKDLVGLQYEQPFKYYEHLRERGFFRVIGDDFVSDKDGTGIVHTAPGFGQEDYNVFVKKGLINKNDKVPCPIDEKGRFTDEVKEYAGMYVKDCDKLIVKQLKDKILISKYERHNYPFCWRSETPLIYRLVSNWFVKVKDSIVNLLENNEKINWVPKEVKYKKFHNWLLNAIDWSISRNRFWGTSIPLWVSDDYSECICIGSVDELEKYSGRKITDLHRENIDDIVIVRNGKELRRIPEVFDCWFESGSMPYAQNNWPFNIKKNFNLSEIKGSLHNDDVIKYDEIPLYNFPADFIGEGIDQTRGWFYTLHVISTLLFNQPAFKNVIVNGIVLAEDGRKMSKKEKNYPDPHLIFDKYGADSLRMYLISSPVVEAEDLKFKEQGVKEILKTLIIPWHNILLFYLESSNSKQYNDDLPLDNWISVSFNTFLNNVTTHMNKYELSKVLGFALSFIDDLSNWYIRIFRKEIRNGQNRLLKKLLVDFSVAMAPFTPFFSEYCYQAVNPGESVHFLMYPKMYETMDDVFQDAKGVIDGIRNLRETNDINLKTPLKQVKLVSSNNDFKHNVKTYEQIILSECNVLSLVFSDKEDIKLNLSAKPKFVELKKDPSTLKKKIEIIRKFSEEDIKKVLNEGFVIKDIKIFEKDVLIEKNIVGCEGVAKAFANFIVILDVTQDDEVLEIKEAREFHSFIQKQRKNSGLKMDDVVYVEVDSDELIKISLKYFDIKFGNPGVFVSKSVYTFKGKEYPVTLRKI